MTRKRLDREQIGIAALALADESGIESVTARNLAERLGVTPMALYRHVPNLATVVDELLDRVLTDAAILDHASPSLDGFLIETFTRIHRCLVEHPAVVPLLSTPAGYGRAALAIVETTLGRFTAARFSPADAVDAFQILLSYTIGSVSIRAAMDARAAAPSGDAFGGFPFTRAAIGPLARLASDRSFARGLVSLVATTVGAQDERVSSTNRRRPTSRRAI